MSETVKIPLTIAVDADGHFCVSSDEDDDGIRAEAEEKGVTTIPVVIYRVEIEVDVPIVYRAETKIEKGPTGNLILRFLRGQ